MALELWKKEIKKARGYNEANFKREAVTNSSFAEKTEVNSSETNIEFRVVHKIFYKFF